MDKKNGRPSKRTPEVVQRVLEGLSKGTPLTVICRADDMPHDNTIRDWAESDDQLSVDIARAREAGFDALAQQCLDIADETAFDTVETRSGPRPDKEWIDRSKLRVETRLKLLAKWDPKRYGDRVQHTGEGGGAIRVNITPDDAAL